MSQKRTRKYKKSKRRRQYGGKYQNGGKRKLRCSRKNRNLKGGCNCGGKFVLKGGCSGCQKNLGKFFTLRPYNNLANGDPHNNFTDTNTNNNVPLPYQKGGGRGTWPQQLGLAGDVLNGLHKVGNFFIDIPNTWRGKPLVADVTPPNPTRQPALEKSSTYRHQIPNYISAYNSSVEEAAGISPQESSNAPVTGGGKRRRRKTRRKTRRKNNKKY